MRASNISCEEQFPANFTLILSPFSLNKATTTVASDACQEKPTD
jgi:hypothetical protein